MVGSSFKVQVFNNIPASSALFVVFVVWHFYTRVQFKENLFEFMTVENKSIRRIDDEKFDVFD